MMQVSQEYGANAAGELPQYGGIIEIPAVSRKTFRAIIFFKCPPDLYTQFVL